MCREKKGLTRKQDIEIGPAFLIEHHDLTVEHNPARFPLAYPPVVYAERLPL
jgi:hypothetical protein